MDIFNEEKNFEREVYIIKQVKLQKNNNSVLEIMIGNSDDISLSKEDFDIALELNEDFFTLQTSYEEFELDALEENTYSKDIA